MVDRKRRCRETEHHKRELPGHERAGRQFDPVFQLLEKDFLIAMDHLPGFIDVLAKFKPKRCIENMMQTKRNERPFDDAENERGQRFVRIDHIVRKRIEPVLNRRPNECHDNAKHDCGRRRHDRHEPLAGEKRRDIAAVRY